MTNLLFHTFKPLLRPQRSLKRRLLPCRLLQNGGAQILQQIAGGAAAGNPPASAETRQKKFIGIINKAYLFPQQCCRLRLLLRAVPAGAEGLAEPDVAFEHPCRPPAGKSFNARIRFRKCFIKRFRLRLGRRGRFRLHRRVGQNIRQLLRGRKIRLDRRRRSGWFLRLLFYFFRQRAYNDNCKPASSQNPGCDQAILCGGKAQQDQQKPNDNALDGTHGVSSFTITRNAAGIFPDSKAAPRPADRRRERRCSPALDKNAVR